MCLLGESNLAFIAKRERSREYEQRDSMFRASVSKDKIKKVMVIGINANTVCKKPVFKHPLTTKNSLISSPKLPTPDYFIQLGK